MTSFRSDLALDYAEGFVSGLALDRAEAFVSDYVEGFVSGHDFSRAVTPEKCRALAPGRAGRVAQSWRSSNSGTSAGERAGGPFKPSFGLSGAVDLVLDPALRASLFTCHPEQSEGPQQGSNMPCGLKPLNRKARMCWDPNASSPCLRDRVAQSWRSSNSGAFADVRVSHIRPPLANVGQAA
jgi:hypothetical protein